jgi:predicted 2-oxoglutarate/Fe(II)-dependent dioxygenase YbiX
MAATSAESPETSMPLTVGDPAPWFMAPTEENPQFNFATLAGRWVGLVFAPDGPTAEGLSRAISLQKDLDEAQACIFGVANAVQGHVDLGPRWFFDASGALAKIYGVSGSAWLILDPTLRVYDHGQIEDVGALVRRLAEMPAPASHSGVEMIAPVLILPRVFEPEFCRELIGVYRAQGGQESGFMREVDGKTKLLTDPRHKQRKDVILEDGAQQAAVRERIVRRLVPEIRKAFQFQATRIERYLVASYAAGAGWFRPHRDNTTKGTAHRKFAVTINLNADDYDGGELRFPEFGNRLYKPPTGGAVVFSCSLMHEARPVTRGERFAFLPFLYDDAGAALREKNLKYVELPDAKAS